LSNAINEAFKNEDCRIINVEEFRIVDDEMEILKNLNKSDLFSKKFLVILRGEKIVQKVERSHLFGRADIIYHVKNQLQEVDMLL
jgi:hypothetical protein